MHVRAHALLPPLHAGLDEAILGGVGLLGGDQATDPEADSKRIAALLRDGAHCLAAMEGEEQARKGDAFAAEDIEQASRQLTGQLVGDSVQGFREVP